MKTYRERKIYVDDSSLEDEDWIMLRKIMRQITCCEVDEERDHWDGKGGKTAGEES